LVDLLVGTLPLEPRRRMRLLVDMRRMADRQLVPHIVRPLVVDPELVVRDIAELDMVVVELRIVRPLELEVLALEALVAEALVEPVFVAVELAGRRLVDLLAVDPGIVLLVDLPDCMIDLPYALILY